MDPKERDKKEAKQNKQKIPKETRNYKLNHKFSQKRQRNKDGCDKEVEAIVHSSLVLYCPLDLRVMFLHLKKKWEGGKQEEIRKDKKIGNTLSKS